MSEALGLVLGTIIGVGGFGLGMSTVRIRDAIKAKTGGKISWLDYMQIRDLMAHGNNYEAAVLTLKKGYDMSEDDMKKLTPQRFHELMMNLRTEKQGVS